VLRWQCADPGTAIPPRAAPRVRPRTTRRCGPGPRRALPRGAARGSRIR
jgi:hypothetical protein